MDEEVDELHKHELLDRIHCASTAFDVLVRDHPAADIMRNEIDEVSNLIALLYQRVGNKIYGED